MAKCEHDWQDDTVHWNDPPIMAAVRCSLCREVRLQPKNPVDCITLRVSLIEDLTEPLQEPLPSPTKAKKLLT